MRDADPHADADADADADAGTATPAVRPQIDGRDFPDGVFALTYDDGPDAITLPLARYLHAHHVARRSSS